MALFVIALSWTVVVSLVLAMCMAARRGDQEEERRAGSASRAEPPAPSRVALTSESRRSDAAPQLLEV
ncbi:MAG TPA: hypothetical protein VNZ01_02255 [Solirubrobacteraceae bacterium]|jgi:hypothetical protein|nr:hypothetical protein [Solirubrobacteraceae bacterium]